MTRPSPNIWNWPQIYEAENRAHDVDDAIWTALSPLADWSGDVVDVGCGTGFHLPRFAEDARSVLGVEPHPPLVETARRRTAHLPTVRVERGDAERLPLPDACADVVHARTAYFFGPGCEPGIREAMRVLRPGGVLVVVDLDASAHDYGRWMRADEPRYDPAATEAFFLRHGFDVRRVDTRWVFEDRRDAPRRARYRVHEGDRGTRVRVDARPGARRPLPHPHPAQAVDGPARHACLATFLTW